MKRRYLITLAALLLFLAACSSDNDLATTPTLEPQFGTADEDIGIGVASVSSGRVYVLSNQTGVLYEEGSNGESYENGFYTRLALRCYDATGNLVWNKQVGEDDCRYGQDASGYGEECDFLTPLSLTADAVGNVYVLSSILIRKKMATTQGISGISSKNTVPREMLFMVPTCLGI